MNALYNHRIKRVDEDLYNYDTRYLTPNHLKSEGEYDMDWVIQNTVILHFCGKSDRDKPWNSVCTNRFAALYKYFWRQVVK